LYRPGLKSKSFDDERGIDVPSAEKKAALYKSTQDKTGECKTQNPSVEEAAEYITDMLAELSDLARRHDLANLATVIEQAGNEAKQSLPPKTSR
jgi:hypothetical protein